MGERERGVSLKRLLEQPDCLLEIGYGALVPEEAALKIEIVRFAIVRRRFHREPRLAGEQPALERGHDRSRDFVLHGEDVRGIPVERLRPKVRAGTRPHQLRADAQPVTRALHAPLEYRGDAELPGDLSGVDVLAAEREGRCSGRDVEASHATQIANERFCYPVPEVLTGALAREILER